MYAKCKYVCNKLCIKKEKKNVKPRITHSQQETTLATT